MIRIAVCDDVPAYVDILTEKIESWAYDRQQNIQLKKFFTGEELVMDLEDSGDFLAVFVDIELNGISGIEVARLIKQKSRIISVIFVSHHQSYYDQIFRFYPFQFIQKPILQSRVYEVLDQVTEIHECLHETYNFVHNRVTFRITLKDVIYFTSERRIVRILMKDGKEYIQYQKLNTVEKLLTEFSKRFVRIHQSYLVNIRQIEQFHKDYVVMSNRELLPISRRRRSAVESCHMENLRKDFRNL